jgi:glycosyltransferase involved in cell wall biosynthesis
MFGTDETPQFHTDLYIKNPTSEEKNTLFNMTDIWLSPSCLEGLHIAPAEAMITKCIVVGNSSPMNGTEDYLIDNETGLVSENTFESFLANIEILINHKTIRNELGKAGREKILSLGSREENMKKMIEVLRE